MGYTIKIGPHTVPRDQQPVRGLTAADRRRVRILQMVRSLSP